MIAGIAAILVASLVGSPHCAGMCGPLAALYAVDASPSGRPLRSHAAYNLARGLAYACLGAIAGTAGAVLDLAGALGGIQRAAAAASGLLMIVGGALAMARALGARNRRRPSTTPSVLGLAGRLAFLPTRSATARAALLGIASALLPCGWLWIFLVAAVGTGSPLWGAASMIVFWVGTLPVLLAVGVAARAASGPLRRHLPVVSAAIVLALGLTVVLSRAVSGEPTTDPAAVAAPLASEPPCHDER